jgi:transcriptional repressor NrdR
MEGLKTLDHVAYIRFASIYKDFNEASDFAEIAGEVVEAPEPPEPTRADKLL